MRLAQINKYWMCKSDRWTVIPMFSFTIEKTEERRARAFIIGFEIIWLKRWCAAEFVIEPTSLATASQGKHGVESVTVTHTWPPEEPKSYDIYQPKVLFWLFVGAVATTLVISALTVLYINFIL